MAKTFEQKVINDQIFTAWLGLITNRDMFDDNSSSIVLTRLICHVLFKAKNIRIEDVLPWQGKHPEDENITVIIEKVARIIDERRSFCSCPVAPIRVLTVENLYHLVKENFSLGQK